MKLRELILVSEDASAGATSSADIATVAYPLFVRGKTPKQKRKNARAAVGQAYTPGPKGVGTGVYESLKEFAPDGFNNGDDGEEFDPGLAQMAYEDGFRKGVSLTDAMTTERAMAINYWHKQAGGVYKQYFFKGFLKGRKEKIRHDNKQYDLNLQLNADGSISHGEQVNEFAPGGDFKPPVPPKEKGNDPWGNDDRSKIVQAVRGLLKAGNKVDWKVAGQMGHVVRADDHGVIMKRWNKPYSKINYSLHLSDDQDDQYMIKMKKPGYYVVVSTDPEWQLESVEEAHVLNHDNVIYRLDRENPMSDTEVAVLGGAGRYSLKALRDKARREAAALAQDLSIEHGGAFRRSAENIKQLTNTINTIVAAYNELARIRRKGGRGSRGITDEDANFIRECIRVVEQATQNYRLMEGLTQEPDPQGYAKDTLTNPKYTIVVNTPGDLDWYKIGTYWNNKIVDPHEFGQDDSDTVMVAQGEEEYKEMLAKIKRMGLTYKTIGGTTDQPEIHDKA